MDEKYTKEGLPIVTEETERAFMSELIRSINTEGSLSYLEKQLEEINSENPKILNYIRRMTMMYPPELHTIAASSLAGIYILFKSQSNNYKILEILQPE